MIARQSALRISLIALFLSSITPPTGHSAPGNDKSAIIFDLGNVLIGGSTRALIKALGISRLIAYKIGSGKSATDLKRCWYQTLCIIQPEGNTLGAKDHEGDRLPPLLCDWLAGTKTSAELRMLTLPAINKHSHWFTSYTEQLLIYRLTRLVFTPAHFAKSRKLLVKGVALLKQFKQKGHPVYVLSNWDAESFEHLAALFPELAACNGIIISGAVGHLKPSSTIFELMKQLCGNRHCMMIDDQIENLEAAHQHDIEPVLYLTKHNKHAQRLFCKKIGAAARSSKQSSNSIIL